MLEHPVFVVLSYTRSHLVTQLLLSVPLPHQALMGGPPTVDTEEKKGEYHYCINHGNKLVGMGIYRLTDLQLVRVQNKYLLFP